MASLQYIKYTEITDIQWDKTYHPGCYISFYRHLPIWASTNLMKSTCLNDIFTCPKRKVIIFFVLKVYVHNTVLTCPIQATVISWSFKMLARIWFYLPRAIGQVLINVTPCISLQNTKLYPRQITGGGGGSGVGIELTPLVAFGGMFVKKQPPFFWWWLAELVPMKVRTIKFWLYPSLVMGL